jgi:rarD protein
MEPEERRGMVLAAASYGLWGILPVYWKWLGHVPSREILAHRIFWSFVFSVLAVLILRRGREFLQAITLLPKQPRQLVLLGSAALIVSGNWYLYIWAVNHGFVTDASLGYYINPLVSALFGFIFLKERLSFWQTVSFAAAAIGVFLFIMAHGTFPWIAFGLAITFGLYGLFKKQVTFHALTGMAVETSFTVLFALAYLLFLAVGGRLAFGSGEIGTDLLLMGAGPATALPLILFSAGARRIPLFMLGILQYIAPTLMLFLGVFLYRENLSGTDLAGFLFIWLALALFTLTNRKSMGPENRKKKDSARYGKGTF